MSTTKTTYEVRALAKSVLSLAAAGGMPDTYWQTDSRITMACTILGWTVEKAHNWADHHPAYNVIRNR